MSIDQFIRIIILVECGICLVPYIYLSWARFKQDNLRFMVRNIAASVAIANVALANIDRLEHPFVHWYSYLPILWVGLLGLALYMTKNENVK